MQTKVSSFIESCVNVAIGYTVALGSQLIIFPLFDIHISMQDNLLISFYFTVISLARSYIVRRFFNNRVST